MNYHSAISWIFTCNTEKQFSGPCFKIIPATELLSIMFLKTEIIQNASSDHNKMKVAEGKLENPQNCAY